MWPKSVVILYREYMSYLFTQNISLGKMNDRRKYTWRDFLQIFYVNTHPA